ncbi:hypothetical protein K5X82_00605 [Halosquirtibacter xylanolyticus]|uniref:hypothetical protein n=1 Tax=Halosquirtibacter xylanolyticus TaxID=3374599 RepID=UPI0037484A85|nr:hypothetical protein K5X82_00605 [Prolixibacteraceae bacterium]
MKKTQTLVIDMNDQFNAIIEDVHAMEASIYRKQYQEAGKCTLEILEQSDRLVEDACKKRGCNHLNPLDKYKEQDFNNIIAFCGERGTGKTSTMISYAQFLVESNKESEKTFWGTDHPIYNDKENTSKHLHHYEYHVTDVIDPSAFENNENLFELVLAKMFSKTIQKIQRSHPNEHQEKEGKRQLLELFSTVYKDLGAIHQKEEDRYKGEALETLSRLACGSNLRDNFKKLVKTYLRFHNHDHYTNKPGVLLIPIDDFDLNTEAATEMGEQIRKYLMIPQVVILMAVNMDQLTNVKEQAVRKKFETLIKADRLYEDPKEFAVNYLVKLIPYSRRIQLCFLDDFAKDTTLQLKQWRHREPQTNKGRSIENIEEFTLNILYELTGLLFIPNNLGTHFLIPKTLRKFRTLVYQLGKLSPTLGKCKEQPISEIQKQNFKQFKKYIYKQIINDNLDKDSKELVESIIAADAQYQNKITIDGIYRLLDKRFRKRIGTNQPIQVESLFSKVNSADTPDQLLRDIYNSDNLSHNISLRDVRYILSKLSNVADIDNNYTLIETIRVVIYLELFSKAIIDNKTLDFEVLCGESILPFFKKTVELQTWHQINSSYNIRINLDDTFLKLRPVDKYKDHERYKEIIDELNIFQQNNYVVAQDEGSNLYVIHNYLDRRKTSSTTELTARVIKSDSDPYFINERIGIHLNVFNEYIALKEVKKKPWLLSLDVIDQLFMGISEIPTIYENPYPTSSNDIDEVINNNTLPLIHDFFQKIEDTMNSNTILRRHSIHSFSSKNLISLFTNITKYLYVYNVETEHQKYYTIEEINRRDKVTRDRERRKYEQNIYSLKDDIDELRTRIKDHKMYSPKVIESILRSQYSQLTDVIVLDKLLEMYPDIFEGYNPSLLKSLKKRYQNQEYIKKSTEEQIHDILVFTNMF